MKIARNYLVFRKFFTALVASKQFSFIRNEFIECQQMMTSKLDSNDKIYTLIRKRLNEKNKMVDKSNSNRHI